jgi:M6 family metalloprotease-like protein
MNTSYRFSKFVGILVILEVILGNAIGAAYAQDEKVPQVSGPVAMQPPPTGPLVVEGQSWSSSGRFNIIWGDGQDGSRQTIYTFTDDNGQKTRLFIDEALSQSVGGVLWFNRKKVSVAGVWGTSLSAKGAAMGLHVTSISLAPSPETGAVSDDVSPAVIGSQPWITIMCKFSDYAVEPRDPAYFAAMYSNIKPRLDHYWRELSYDTANVVGSNAAAAWVTLPHTEAYYNPTDTQGGTDLDLLAQDCTAAANASVNFALYQTGGINMMFNTNFDNGYAWGGTTDAPITLDGVTKNWRMTWEPPWAYGGAGYDGIAVIQHEMGHGFGLPHSSTPWGQVYQNAWDVMSQDRYNCAAATDPTYGCYAQHTISYHKDILGWIPALQKVTVPVGTSTTITLEQLALPATANYKMAKIPIGGSSTHFYTVEARRLTGYDAKLAGAAIIIHDVNTARQEPAWIVDPNGAPSSDASAMWVVGETFTDTANNISVRVDSATATGFAVTIANNTALPPPITDTSLSNGVALNQTMTASVSQGTTKYYYVDLPAGSSNLVVDLYNLTGNLDLYVRQGSKPTLSSYDCRPYIGGLTSESCSFASPSSGRWWIGVTNWATGTLSYTIKASWNIGYTGCSGGVVVLQNVTFTAGNTYNCSATTSITAGTGVTVKSGATVSFRAPIIDLQPGFRVENGAVFSAKQ